MNMSHSPSTENSKVRFLRLFEILILREKNCIKLLLEIGKLLQLAIEEVQFGPINAQKALKLENAEGNFRTRLEAIIDAKGVYTSIEHANTNIPAESSLLTSVHAVRGALEEKRLTTLYLCDTRDMVADGLTKGL